MSSLGKNFKTYAPSKRIVIPLLIISALGAGYWITKRHGISFFSPRKSLESVTVKDLVEKDTDGDGLKDWEEPLWGMDPKKFDTDGNGIADGEEVSRRRSLLAQEDQKPPRELSRSDILTRDLYTVLASLKQEGQLNDRSMAQVTSLVVDYIKNDPDKKIYARNDLKVTADTPQSVGMYSRDVTTVFQAAELPKENPVLIAQAAMEGGGSAEAKKLNVIKEQYRKIATALLGMPVPESAVPVHVALVNTLHDLATDTENMAKVNEEPLFALAGLSQYPVHLEELSAENEALKEYLISQKDALSANR